MDSSKKFQMMPEFMAKNTAQEFLGLWPARLRMRTVKRTPEHDDLPDTGIDLVLSHGEEIVASCIIRNDQRLGHNDTAGELTKEFFRELIQQFRNDVLVFFRSDHERIYDGLMVQAGE